MYKILLAPTLEAAKSIDYPEASVEAEYGEECVRGRMVTLAHHTREYQGNPAPCNSAVDILPDGSAILISHIDLDTLGGIFALTGRKRENREFWEAAEFIDLNGSHHIHELPGVIQEKLNAFYAFETMMREQARLSGRYPFKTLTDVTEDVESRWIAIDAILDLSHPEHDEMIRRGVEWNRKITKKVESKLVCEVCGIREFITDGVFCSASYYSPRQGRIMPATISYNTVSNAITVSFADQGEKINARDFVQTEWGDKAGGHAGIAGSPRGKKMDITDFYQAAERLAVLMGEKYHECIEAGRHCRTSV